MSIADTGCRVEFERVLLGRRFAFSVLVHADESSPMVDFLATSSVLQVRCCCILRPPACNRGFRVQGF